MFAKFFTIASLAASALATVYVTSPTASSSLTAGQNATVSWIDSNTAPSLAQFGLSSISVYVGNALQQTLLQTIATNVNVSKVQSVTFQPQASIGPNSDDYFIRFDSLTNTSALAFSAKFALTGMSGQFNASVQAQINGQSSAPLAAPTPAPSASASGIGAVASVTGVSGSATPTGSSASSNGAVGGYAGSAAALLASGLLSAYLAL